MSDIKDMSADAIREEIDKLNKQLRVYENTYNEIKQNDKLEKRKYAEQLLRSIKSGWYFDTQYKDFFYVDSCRSSITYNSSDEIFIGWYRTCEIAADGIYTQWSNEEDEWSGIPENRMMYSVDSFKEKFCGEEPTCVPCEVTDPRLWTYVVGSSNKILLNIFIANLQKNT